jgi:enterochelin esterase-like enzyme
VISVIGDLTVVSTNFLICFGVVTIVMLALALTRRRRALTRRISLMVASLLTLVLIADGFNSYYSYLPNVSDVVDAVTQPIPPTIPANTPAAVVTKAPTPGQIVRGRLITLPIPGGGGIGPSLAWVWLPPAYFQPSHPRLAVLYLFHGSPGRPQDWFHAGRAATAGQQLSRQNQPVIEVAPRMSRDWLDDPECVDGRHEQVETHLIADIIPTVDRSLRTIATRQGRIFAGMSAGGYCALNLGLRHRDLVSTILDLSGYTVPTHSGGMRALFGPNPDALAAQNSPAEYASRLRDGPPMRVWLDSGSADTTVLREMAAIAPILRADGMTVVQADRRGGHTYSVWRPALRQSAEWALDPG